MMPDSRRKTSAHSMSPLTKALRGRLLLLSAACGACLCAVAMLPADDAASESVRQLTIDRIALNLKAPESYQVPMALDAVRTLELTSQVDGTVATIQVALGDEVTAQTEAIRLESTIRELELERAQAQLRQAEALQKSAEAEGDPNAMEAAAAAVDVADAELNLAQFRLEQAIVRFPFPGQVTAIHVSVGQYVRIGDPLMTVIDASQLTVELPIVRNSVQPGDSLAITVEQATANGEVQVVLPLAERFGPLRDLVPSIASAIVVIDNPTEGFAAGQTVYSPLIPRNPVTEVSTAAIQNSEDGLRKVQVMRDGVVRDIPVDLLGQEGDAYVFVSGRFAVGDELILSSSVPLLDGDRPISAAEAQAAANSQNRPQTQGSDF